MFLSYQQDKTMAEKAQRDLDDTIRKQRRK